VRGFRHGACSWVVFAVSGGVLMLFASQIVVCVGRVTPAVKGVAFSLTSVHQVWSFQAEAAVDWVCAAVVMCHCCMCATMLAWWLGCSFVC
jgi:hypothetical protein